MKITRVVLASAVGLVLAGPALAQNASTAGALELYPTWHAVGARLTYAGDANGNATARLEWRPQGAATWTPGMAMTRITSSRWAASVMWLQPDSPVEVRATITDPDGGGSATGSARTRPEPATIPTGATIWVATNGSDANPGSPSSPLATLQAAADRANPGDQIRVKPGIYYQTVDVQRAGTAAALIHLVADAPGVILDGSDPAFLQRSDWRADGGGVYSLPFTATTRLVCADSTMRLYHHPSLSALQSGGTYGIQQGWVVEGGRLSVRLEGGLSPNGRKMHVGRYATGVFLDRSYWRVNGFEMRYYGTTLGSGVTIMNANGCVVSDNYIHTIGGKGVYLRVGANDCLVERNSVRDFRTFTWSWDATKAHDEEQQGISHRGGRGVAIRYNTISGTFDGIDTSDDGSNENSGADCDIHENVITQTRDDALEPEMISGINTRIWRNRIDAVFSGISIAPNFVGPTYVLYNTFTNYSSRGYKCSISSVGQTYVFHNTWSSTYPTASVHPTGPFSNVHFRNNILTGNGSACVSDDSGESQTGNDFDGDLISSNYAALFRWKNTNYSSIAALRSATGFEVNGRAGDPMFTSASTGDYRLRPGSPAIDGAIRLPGINDGFVGAGPDMGALEYLSGVDLTPPAAIRDLR